MRPDLCIVDASQTRESALSTKQYDDRERVIKADILGMVGSASQSLVFGVLPSSLRTTLRNGSLTENETYTSEATLFALTVVPKMVDLWDEFRGSFNAELMNDGDKILLKYVVSRDMREVREFVESSKRG